MKNKELGVIVMLAWLLWGAGCTLNRNDMHEEETPSSTLKTATGQEIDELAWNFHCSMARPDGTSWSILLKI